jgi:hypothetical protein
VRILLGCSVRPAMSPMPPPPQHRQREHHGSAHPGVQLETAARLVMPAQPRRGAGLARAGQGEGDQRVAGRGAGFAMAAGGDQDILAALPAIACRGGDAGGR